MRVMLPGDGTSSRSQAYRAAFAAAGARDRFRRLSGPYAVESLPGRSGLRHAARPCRCLRCPRRLPCGDHAREKGRCRARNQRQPIRRDRMSDKSVDAPFGAIARFRRSTTQMAGSGDDAAEAEPRGGRTLRAASASPIQGHRHVCPSRAGRETAMPLSRLEPC